MAELVVEILEIAKDAAEKEVLADVAERPLDLTLRFCAIGPTGARLKAVMTGEVDKGAVVDDEPVGVLADDRGLHAIVEDRARRSADRLQSGDMAAQDALQILVEDEPRPDQPGIAEHHREQPDDALIPGSSRNSTSNLAKSTCACSPGGVSKRTSYPALRAGR